MLLVVSSCFPYGVIALSGVISWRYQNEKCTHHAFLIPRLILSHYVFYINTEGNPVRKITSYLFPRSAEGCTNEHLSCYARWTRNWSMISATVHPSISVMHNEDTGDADFLTNRKSIAWQITWRVTQRAPRRKRQSITCLSALMERTRGLQTLPNGGE